MIFRDMTNEDKSKLWFAVIAFVVFIIVGTLIEFLVYNKKVVAKFMANNKELIYSLIGIVILIPAILIVNVIIFLYAEEKSNKNNDALDDLRSEKDRFQITRNELYEKILLYEHEKMFAKVKISCIKGDKGMEFIPIIKFPCADAESSLSEAIDSFEQRVDDKSIFSVCDMHDVNEKLKKKIVVITDINSLRERLKIEIDDSLIQKELQERRKFKYDLEKYNDDRDKLVNIVAEHNILVNDYNEKKKLHKEKLKGIESIEDPKEKNEEIKEWNSMNLLIMQEGEGLQKKSGELEKESNVIKNRGLEIEGMQNERRSVFKDGFADEFRKEFQELEGFKKETTKCDEQITERDEQITELNKRITKFNKLINGQQVEAFYRNALRISLKQMNDIKSKRNSVAEKHNKALEDLKNKEKKQEEIFNSPETTFAKKKASLIASKFISNVFDLAIQNLKERRDFIDTRIGWNDRDIEKKLIGCQPSFFNPINNFKILNHKEGGDKKI